MNIRLTVFTLLLSLMSSLTYSQVGIGTNTPHSSSIVDVSATNKAFLLPRLTSEQRASISSPANGLVIFCTNCGTNGEMQVYSTSAWKNVLDGAVALSTPTLSTTAVSNISYTTVTAGGTVTYSETTVSARGVCWSTSQNPTLASSTLLIGNGTGVFSSSITGLTLNTTYFLRAYATNSTGTSYGNQVTFTTLAAIPASFATTTSSAITGYSATISSNITSNNGATVTSRGVCYSTTQNPTTANNPQTNGSGNGAYDINITGLLANTTYYVRSYAINSAGTGYSDEISFTTGIRSLPTLTTSTANPITATTGSSGGNITSSGNDLLIAKGVCWSTSQSPTITDPKSSDGTSTGTYVSSITGLTPNTTYYVRAYATNSVGTAYGNQVSFISTPTLQGSLTFNGTNQYLQLNQGLTFGTGAFTVEGWIYNTDALNTDGIIGFPTDAPAPANTGALFMGFLNNSNVTTTIYNNVTGNNNTYSYLFTNAITTNAWHYFIFNRNANDLTAFFIDGVKSTTNTDVNNYFGPATWIGRNYWNGYWPGYITNLKITIGAAIYDSNAATSTIANPTAELTATGTTKLLLLGNSATTDAAGVQTITNNGTSGGVGVSTTLKPF